MQPQQEARLDLTMGASVTAPTATSVLRGLPTVDYIPQSTNRNKLYHQLLNC